MTQVIRSAAEAEAVAGELARTFAAGAADRDRTRRLPGTELDELSRSGLLGIAVPARFGGAEVPATTLATVFAILAAADASIAQIPHSHFVFLDALRRTGSEAQQERFFAEALAGARFANAQSERGGRTITDDATTLSPREDGTYVLDGVKYYSTGALFADWLVVRAVRAGVPVPDGAPVPKALVYLRRETPGVAVDDDWDGMGQRTTASGTVRLEGAVVDEDAVVAYNALFEGPTTYGARAQLLHAALDVGLARGALAAGTEQAGRARPWFEAGVDRAADDPLLIQRAGELEIAVRAAEALLREAGAAIDAAEAALTAETAAAASIATAVAKVAASRASVDVASALFELGGTRAASDSLNLSRFWRDARTHTLHDPERWKVQHIGRWTLSRTPPPRHGLL
ncbi:SfnB family sulfur acquisition oxidoreductase [Cryptosporangium aurantiacum]|uniref:Sulfur acquisition oxidoreductase, SfnB family n=1 Tax=Cryptosporangium aurantiacum TaxID=134849 RepID=A0A1M7TZD9_9ACTN|nr:SfnB family sulfur acquisition oxidoreductase [Cryptosporangium aurantiacum]SHN76101.1 sulfur acquisition oxidoreductase, SfnB family [Cryptosporangium aurantiacum]